MSNSKLVPPRITISMVEGIMKRAAKGHSEAITELESLLAHYERPGSHRPDSDIKEVKAALTYAKAMAATRNSLHVFDLDVKRFMKQVLRGESDAFTRLVAIASSDLPSAKEADVVVRFLTQTLAEPES